MQGESPREPGSRLQLQTLIVASLASASAALVSHHLWRNGTVLSAAMTPLIVAFMSELLHRPARRISEVRTGARPAVGLDRPLAVARRAERAAAGRTSDDRFDRLAADADLPVPAPESDGAPTGERSGPAGAPRASDGSSAPEAPLVSDRPWEAGPPRASDRPWEAGPPPASDRPWEAGPRPGASAPRPDDYPVPDGEPVTQIHVYRRPRFNVKVALATGALAFVVAAAALTLPELVAGQAVGGQGRTTLFSSGGSSDRGSQQGQDRGSGDRGKPGRDRSPQPKRTQTSTTTTRKQRPAPKATPKPSSPPSSGQRPKSPSGGGGSTTPSKPPPSAPSKTAPKTP